LPLVEGDTHAVAENRRDKQARGTKIIAGHGSNQRERRGCNFAVTGKPSIMN